MKISRSEQTKPPFRHPRGRAIVVIVTLVVVLLVLGLAAAAYFLTSTAKPLEVKAVKKVAAPTISPRILHDSSSSRR